MRAGWLVSVRLAGDGAKHSAAILGAWLASEQSVLPSRRSPGRLREMRPRVGETINGKYRLIRLIGEGGMGSVFEARHEYLGSAVALKFLDPELARRSGLVARFLREARVSATVQSPHIVQVSDVDESSTGLPYIVMEILHGESLQTLLARVGKLAFDTSLDFSVQILNGLEAAHNAGIVHRDLKPDNVFVVPTRQGSLVKLLDFGIAKLRVSEEFQRGLTRPGVLMGTPEYMAPEQAFSADTADHRADLYALGVIMFEMLTGRRPIPGDDPRIMAAVVLSGKVPLLTDVDPSMPAGLATAIARALHGKPADRFASAAEMRAAIAPYCKPTPHSGLGATFASPSVVSGPADWQGAARGGVPPPTPTAPGSDPPAPLAPTLPPSEPGSRDAMQSRTGTVMGAPHQVQPNEYGPTAQITPYPYGQIPQPGAYYPQTPLPTRVGTRQGLSLGIVAAIAGALVVATVVALAVMVNRDCDSDSQNSNIAPTVPGTVPSVPPTNMRGPDLTVPSTATGTPATTQLHPPPTTTTARRDAGTGDGWPADAGFRIDAGLVFPFPSALPSTFPSAFPFPLPSLPIPIPGFPP